VWIDITHINLCNPSASRQGASSPSSAADEMARRHGLADRAVAVFDL
jgi:hypothetical protein